jgi:simple sugar transport system ATP-binding protein
VLVDEPTRGVDVGAITKIQLPIYTLADDGHVAIVIVSEIMKLSDNSLYFRQRCVVEEISPVKVTADKIMFAAVH